MGHGQGSEGDPDPLRTGKAEEGPRSLGPSWLSAAPPSDWLPASPLGLGPLPHLLYTPPLLSLPACSRALTSFPLPPLKIPRREGSQARGHIQTPLRSMGPDQAPGAQEIQGQPPDYLLL